MKLEKIVNYNNQFQPTRQNYFGDNNKKTGNNVSKIGIAAVSIASTILPIIAISKYQGKGLNKDVFQKLPIKDKGKALLKSLSVDYGLKEMLLVGLSSIFGGALGGAIFDKNTDKKEKVKEGVHKAFALSVPATLVTIGCALSKKTNVKAPIGELASVALGVGLGMPIANKISNAINKKAFKEKDNYEKRGIKASDYLMHVDDIVGAMVLAKVPFVNTLQLDKVLAAIYAHEGYEVGTAKTVKE